MAAMQVIVPVPFQLSSHVRNKIVMLEIAEVKQHRIHRFPLLILNKMENTQVTVIGVFIDEKSQSILRRGICTEQTEENLRQSGIGSVSNKSLKIQKYTFWYMMYSQNIWSPQQK